MADDPGTAGQAWRRPPETVWPETARPGPATASLPDEDVVATVDAFLARSLAPGLPPELPADLSRLPERALYHGVSALMASRPQVLERLPSGIAQALREQARAEAMWDLRHRQVLAPVLEAFAMRGVDAVLMKGTALAYGLYASPALRPRGDSDLLVRADHMEPAYEALRAHGFAPVSEPDTRAVEPQIRQEVWKRPDAAGNVHSIDLHWQVMNAIGLWALFDPAEVICRAQPAPSLSPAARIMDWTQALYHACLHRAVHVRSPYIVGDEAYTGGDRLIWYHDIALIAGRLTSRDWTELMGWARAHGTADLCHEALAGAVRLCGANLPDGILPELGEQGRGAAAHYLLAATPAQQLRADLRAIPGVPGKLSFLRRRLFPSAAGLRARFPGRAHWPAPLLYVMRLGRVFRR